MRMRIWSFAFVIAVCVGAPAFAQNGSSMGSAGATGGVAGSSAAAGAQGANSNGAASGAGPNLSPVIPTGVGNSANNNSNTPNGAQGSGVATGQSSNTGTFSNGGAANRSSSTRSRFGNDTSVRSGGQSADSTGLFSPGTQVFGNGAGGAVRPNRTYRSDLGAWQMVGPFQPGSSMNPLPNATGMAAQYAPANDNYGNYFSPGNAGGAYTNGYANGGVTTVAPAPEYATPAPRGTGFGNSLAPPANVGNAMSVGGNGSPEAERPSPSQKPIVNSAPLQPPRLGIAMAPGFTGSGARISRVVAGSLAERAGLRPGDIVTSFNGNGVYGYQDILAATQTLPTSGVVEIIAWRNSESVPLVVEMSPSTESGPFDPNLSSASNWGQ